jgi:uncharacterized protein YgiM (DUF1202 family)
MSNVLRPVRLLPVVVFLVLLTPTLVRADQVTPAPSVAGYVNVRESPTVDSPVVGKLVPGESAELRESVPYWYCVVLADGTTGYVSKAWTVTLSDAQESGTLSVSVLGIFANWDMAVARM